MYSAFQKQSKLVAIDWLLTRAEEKTTIEEEIELLLLRKIAVTICGHGS